MQSVQEKSRWLSPLSWVARRNKRSETISDRIWNKIYDVQSILKIPPFFSYETAYQAHRASPYFQAWLNGAKEMIVSRKMIETNPVVFGSKAMVVP